MNISNLLKSNDLGTKFKEETKKLYRYRKTCFKLLLDNESQLLHMIWSDRMELQIMKSIKNF